jgi:DNA-binding transcriptional regulator GbsR (MarR family)
MREQRLLVEEFGLMHEEMGGTRMAGRVAAWLLLCEPPVQSLTQISDALGVSKPAVCGAAKSLLQAGLVERVSEPGRRGDYYRSVGGHLDSVLQYNRIDALSRLVQRSLSVVADRDQQQSNYLLLHDLSDFLDFLKAEIPGLMARWQSMRAAHRANGAESNDNIKHGGAA